MADEDYGVCEHCGEPLTEQDDFNRRATLIADALEDAEPVMVEALLAMFAGYELAAYEATERKKARRGLIRSIDESTRDIVIRDCDA